MLFIDVIRRYEAYLRYDKLASASTLKSLQGELRRFAQRWFDRDIELITENDVQLLRYELHAKEYGAGYIVKILSTLRAIFRFCKEELKLTVLDAKCIKLPSYPKRPASYLTHEELENLLDFNTRTLVGARLMAWIALTLSTGMRVSESMSLKRNDIRKETITFQGKAITFYKASIIGKGKLPREIIIQPFAMQWIEHYLKKRTDNHEALFIRHYSRTKNAPGKSWSAEGVRQQLMSAEKRVGRRVKPHELRRTAATFTHHKGAQEKTIQDFLGHRSLQYTDRYLGVNYHRLAFELNKYVRYDEIGEAPSTLKAWAEKEGWECCQKCGTTNRPHSAKGLCHRCYMQLT